MKRSSARIVPLITLLVLGLGLAACQVAAPRAALRPAPGSTAAPPPIPHAVAAADGGAICLGCHGEGLEGAPKTPHPQLVDCRQCHIPRGAEVPPFAPVYGQ